MTCISALELMNYHIWATWIELRNNVQSLIQENAFEKTIILALFCRPKSVKNYQLSCMKTFIQDNYVLNNGLTAYSRQVFMQTNDGLIRRCIHASLPIDDLGNKCASTNSYFQPSNQCSSQFSINSFIIAQDYPKVVNCANCIQYRKPRCFA